jgi:hypothetical protein
MVFKMVHAERSREALMSTANSSALVTAKSITNSIPASFSFFAVVGSQY